MEPISILVILPEKSSAPPNLSGAAETYVTRRHASRIRMAPAAEVAAGRRRGLGKLDLLFHSDDILNHCFNVTV
jgi:hypothetical protein